jgi:hypothetical protein
MLLLPGASEEQSPFYSYFNLFKNKKKLQARGASPAIQREGLLCSSATPCAANANALFLFEFL